MWVVADLGSRASRAGALEPPLREACCCAALTLLNFCPSGEMYTNALCRSKQHSSQQGGGTAGLAHGVGEPSATGREATGN